MGWGTGNIGGGSGGLNFKIVGGTSEPSALRENTIWVNTDKKITSRHFGADEPNVYDVKLSFEGNNAWIDAPHQLSVGDILNFVIPGTHYSPLEDINIVDVITGKTYSVRQGDGTAVRAWTAGIKVGVKISNNIHPIGNHSGYHGSAYLVSWDSYYHEEGTVWVTTGASSPVAFNALKKNTIMVYPISAKQYIGGAWVDVTAKSYQGGAWVDWWSGELYTPGNEWTGVTGGWEAKRSLAEQPGTVEKTANGLVLSTNDYQLIFCKTVNKIDLSKYSKVTFDLTQVDITGFASCLLGICNDAFGWSWTTSNLSAYQELRKEAVSGEYVLDVSNLSGMFYVFIRPACSNGEYCNVTVKEVRME